MDLFGSMKHFVADRSLSPKMTVTLRNENPGQPAANVSLIKSAGVNMEKRVNASVVSLTKKGVSGTRWAVIGLVDESGSAAPFYRNGHIQMITEGALGWAAAVDNDGSVPFGGFSSVHDWKDDVNLTNFSGIVDRQGWGPKGSTNLSDSLDAALELAQQSTDPVYLLIITDGAPDDRARVKRQIQDMSQYPIFIKFLVFGKDRAAQAFMEELDDMTTGRLVDNVDAKVIENPGVLSEQDVADIMTDETDTWLVAAKSAGLVR